MLSDSKLIDDYILGDAERHFHGGLLLRLLDLKALRQADISNAENVNESYISAFTRNDLTSRPSPETLQTISQRLAIRDEDKFCRAVYHCIRLKSGFYKEKGRQVNSSLPFNQLYKLFTEIYIDSETGAEGITYNRLAELLGFKSYDPVERRILGKAKPPNDCEIGEIASALNLGKKRIDAMQSSDDPTIRIPFISMFERGVDYVGMFRDAACRARPGSGGKTIREIVLSSQELKDSTNVLLKKLSDALGFSTRDAQRIIGMSADIYGRILKDRPVFEGQFNLIVTEMFGIASKD